MARLQTGDGSIFEQISCTVQAQLSMMIADVLTFGLLLLLILMHSKEGCGPCTAPAKA